MLKNLVKHLIRRDKQSDNEATKNTLLESAAQMMGNDDFHGAANAYREYLKIDPYHVGALNNLGACLMDVGKTSEAEQAFELAHSLDDTYIVGITNYARRCLEQNLGADALKYLRQAKICGPQYSHVDTVYAAYCLRMGEVSDACYYQKKAWFVNFDKMRYANCYLFYLAYHDVSDLSLAMEHRFWGETVHPLGLKTSQQSKNRLDEQAPKKTGRKIRIGYWSPDLRNHSVRFFFRPLLENHDTSNFDILVYHDGPVSDAQTELIEAASTQFFRSFDLSDAELSDLMHSHELDILVELAGHSSYNRITLMQQRFAPVQMTALGYPPTVGLSTIDVKVLDRHVVVADSASFYAEYPLALPTSFWCFDPLEEAPTPSEPPVVKNGYITFACVGTLAKINERMLRCWKAIFDQVPGCRFQMRSINFEDPDTEVAMRGHLAAAGIDLDMVDFYKPAAGTALFLSTYSEIDIILDTFPFNGGTTTCSATYMGVPVVSLAGQSLISRMGLSVLSNLNVPHLAVSTEEDYVARAVELANDEAFLSRFRQEARGLFKQTSLGNGQLFAQEFEQACQWLLEQKQTGAPAHQSIIPALPVDELVRRGYAVLSQSPDAAKRILEHCLREYPNSGSAKLLAAQLLVTEQGPAAGLDYLAPLVEGFTPDEQVEAVIAMTRWCMLTGQLEQARQGLDRLLKMPPLEDDFDRWQVQLYDACCQAYADGINGGSPLEESAKAAGPKYCRVLITCDDEAHFETLKKQMASTCLLPDGWRVSYERCRTAARIEAYQRALNKNDADLLVLLQKNVSVYNPLFFQEVVAALQNCDILSFAGATRWQRMDWRTDEFSRKAAGFMVPSSEVAGFCEIQWFGPRSGHLVGNLAVLDGNLLAVAPSRVRHVAFDEALLGAEQMVEEDWTHTAFKTGLRLSAHRGLGILMAQGGEPDMREHTPAMMSLLEKRGFDPFSIEKTDSMYISASMASMAEAILAMDIFINQSTNLN